MIPALIAFPVIDPVAINLGPVPIRWYALAYIVGLVAGWYYGRALCRSDALWGGAPRPDPARLDDLVVNAAFGVILGGRLGYVIFYNPMFYLAHPLDVFALWNGGMAFHGALVGGILGVWVFARRYGLPLATAADLSSAAVPIGLFLGRIANFIKPELWGRPTDVPWAMIFPDAGPLPRHPSQLYEAGLEGIVLFLILLFVVQSGGFKRPGLVTGLFGIGYGCARIFCEFFREPDPQLGFLFGGATMGMLLSVPLILAGAGFVAYSMKQKVAEP